jgi:hypothetical protein
MITTKIRLTPYLAEYARGKFGQFCDENTPITFSSQTDIYYLLWDLLQQRPIGVTPIDDGNLSVNLPCRRHGGKNPAIFNYLSQKSQSILNLYIKRLFDNDLHDTFEANLHNGHPLDNIEIAYQFLAAYNITHLTEDAILKNYYRWRESIRKKRNRRKYTRNKVC